MAQIQLQKISSEILTPATPEASEFLQRIKIGEWIHADFKRVRNYQFHKRFFKLLQLGFDYWTPTGGAILPEEQKLVNGFVDFLCRQVGQQHSVALSTRQNNTCLMPPTRALVTLRCLNPSRHIANG